jgi:hypothetical protein
VNAYAHADAEGPTIYLILVDVFQTCYKDCHGIELTLGSCVPLLKAMQGHPEVGNWWLKRFYRTFTAPLDLKPAFTDPTIYRRDDNKCSGPTLMIRQVNVILVGVEDASDRDSVLDGIALKGLSPVPPSGLLCSTPQTLNSVHSINESLLSLILHFV